MTPEENPYIVADNLARSLRAHIRILCRAITAGPRDVPTDLVEALIAAVKSGALEHKERGRIAAFAPQFEKPSVGRHPDRSLAQDLTGALDRLQEPRRSALLAAILED